MKKSKRLKIFPRRIGRSLLLVAVILVVLSALWANTQRIPDSLGVAPHTQTASWFSSWLGTINNVFQTVTCNAVNQTWFGGCNTYGGGGGAAGSISLSASPNPAPYGGSTTLTWNYAADGGNCTISGGQFGAGVPGQPHSASHGAGPLYTTTTYTFSCGGAGFEGGSQDKAGSSASVTVGVLAPTLTLTATPSTLPYNGSATVDWSARNGAGGCHTWGPGVDSYALVDTKVTGPLRAYQNHYILSCSQGGSIAADVYVDQASNIAGFQSAIPAHSTRNDEDGVVTCDAGYVLQGAECMPQPASISITANQGVGVVSVYEGDSATIRWQSVRVVPGSCRVTNNQTGTVWTGDNNTVGQETGPLHLGRIYTLRCNNTDSSSVQATVSLSLLAADIVNFVANPDQVRKGRNTSLSWQSGGMEACAIRNHRGVVVATGLASSGTPVTISEHTVLTLSCTVGTETYQKSITVGVLPAVDEI